MNIAIGNVIIERFSCVVFVVGIKQPQIVCINSIRNRIEWFCADLVILFNKQSECKY